MQSACVAVLSHTEVYHTYLLLKIESDRSKAEVGQPIRIRFTTRNTGNEPIVLESPDTPVIDIVVDFSDGSELLTWSSHNPDQVVHRLEWKPGESKTIEFVWIPKREDISIGSYKNAYPSGRLYSNGKIVKSAGVTVCASDVC
jgi:aminopeptidase N